MQNLIPLPPFALVPHNEEHSKMFYRYGWDSSINPKGCLFLSSSIANGLKTFSLLFYFKYLENWQNNWRSSSSIPHTNIQFPSFNRLLDSKHVIKEYWQWYCTIFAVLRLNRLNLVKDQHKNFWRANLDVLVLFSKQKNCSSNFGYSRITIIYYWAE